MILIMYVHLCILFFIILLFLIGCLSFLISECHFSYYQRNVQSTFVFSIAFIFCIIYYNLSYKILFIANWWQVAVQLWELISR